MRRIADLTPGNAKTDAKDAAVIADAARTMPHTLRSISTSDEDAASLSMLTGFDLDLARQVNQTANRIRGLYTQTHPALEAVLGKWLEHDPILEVIAAWPTPADLRKAGRARIDAKPRSQGRQAPCRLGAGHHRRSGQADRGRGRYRRRRSSAAPPGPPAHRPTRPEA